MQTDKEIKDKAFEQLEKLTSDELKDINELQIEVYLKNSNGIPERFVVFFERGFVNNKEGWVVRNIIYPDKLQRPENKEEGKIE